MSLAFKYQLKLDNIERRRYSDLPDNTINALCELVEEMADSINSLEAKNTELLMALNTIQINLNSKDSKDKTVKVIRQQFNK